MKEQGIESKTLDRYNAVFDSLKEAVKYAQKLAYSMQLHEYPGKNRINTVRIEDRLCGEIYIAEYIAVSRGKWGGWKFFKETHSSEKDVRDLW